MLDQPSKNSPSSETQPESAQLPRSTDIPDLKNKDDILEKIRKSRKQEAATAFDIVSDLDIGDIISYFRHVPRDQGASIQGRGKLIGFQSKNLLSIVLRKENEEIIVIPLGPSAYSTRMKPRLKYKDKRASITYKNGQEKARIMKIS